MSWMGQYMMGLLSGIDAQSRQRENDWRHARQEQERMQFADTLQRQRENEARAREEAAMNRHLSQLERQHMADQYGLTFDLQGDELAELNKLKSEAPALQYAERLDVGEGPAGSTPDFGTKSQAQAERKGEAKAKLARLKFLEQKQLQEKSRPITVREASLMDKTDRGYPRAKGLSYEERIGLKQADVGGKMELEKFRQGAIRERFDISQQDRRVQFDEMMNFRYASLDAAQKRAETVRSSTEQVAAMRTLAEQANRTEATLAELNTAINSLAEDPNTVEQQKYLISRRNALQQKYSQAVETLSSYAGRAPSGSQSATESESVRGPRGEAPPLEVKSEVSEDAAKRVVSEADAAGKKVEVRVQPAKILGRKNEVKAKGAGPQGVDAQALEWAKKNPKDKRAAAIMERLRKAGLIE